MSQSAFHTPAGNIFESYDFNENYQYLKKLIGDLKAENGTSVAEDIFGEDGRNKKLTKKQMKELFRFLRKIEKHYEDCCKAPIPEELEKHIRSRASSEWLPWEMEAVEKVEAWREEVRERKARAREMLKSTLEKVRRGDALS